MRLNSFLTVTALSIHYSCVSAAQAGSNWGLFSELAAGYINSRILTDLSEVAKGQEPPECLTMLETASMSNFFDKKTILDAMDKGCNSYLRYAFWKMSGVLPSAPTEDGEEDIVAPLSIGGENGSITLRAVSLAERSGDFEKGCMPLLLSYFWAQGWLVSDGNMEKFGMLALYTHHIFAVDNPELLERLFIKALQTPNHFMNKINNNRNDDWNIKKTKKSFLEGVIVYDAVKIYNHLVHNGYLSSRSLCSQFWLQYVLIKDAVKIFDALQCPIGADELCWMYVSEGTKILNLSLKKGIHLSITDARPLLGDGIAQIKRRGAFASLHLHHIITAHVTITNEEILFRRPNERKTMRDTRIKFLLPRSFLPESKFYNERSKLFGIQCASLLTFICLIGLILNVMAGNILTSPIH